MQYKNIQEQFNKVIAYSQEFDNPNTDDLFARWLEAKRDFIEAMRGQLIWEWPEKVSFELGNKEKNLRISDFSDLVAMRWDNPDLADFIEVERKGFFSNQVVENYTTRNGACIPKGMKLLKAFKFFEGDSKALNDIQSAASMIIQEDKIEGTLCLSVHPLDFLSVSENNHNWRSCHALNGEYRAGNLSYMTDSSTIICYLKSAKNEVLPDFPEDVKWNSKKWRVLLYFSDGWNMLFAGRQYPFFSETGIDFVKNRVLPVVNMGKWSDWSSDKLRNYETNINDFYFRSPYIPFADRLLPLKDLVINAPGSLQFNDVLSSSCYDPMYAYRTDGYCLLNNFTPKFIIGGKVKCCKCGEKDIELSETMMCTDCELKYGNSDSDTFATCNCCGNRFVYDDGVWIESREEMICQSCADEYTDYCSNCGERFYIEDMKYHRKTESTYCKWCFMDMDLTEDFEPEDEE